MKNKKEMRLYKRIWCRIKRGSTKETLSNSATWKGRRAEIVAMSMLSGAIDNNKEALNRGFDILWNGFRVDVKSCNLYKRKTSRGKPVGYCGGWWVFNKNKNDADLYFCICMVDNVPVRYYLIPHSGFGGGITVGYKSSKYHQYEFKKEK